jgi:hypothetical protein
MMILNAIRNAFATQQKRNWEKTYWAFDIHGTMILPNYQAGNIPTEFYPFAKETLQEISKRKDICLILYTCSHPHEIVDYLAYFKSLGIRFDYVNKNPEAENTAYGNYTDKLYFNVLFEDKAGFNPETDWEAVLNFMLDRK